MRTRPSTLAALIGTLLMLVGWSLFSSVQTASAADLIPLFRGGLRYVTLPGFDGSDVCGIATGDVDGDGKQDVLSWTQRGLSVQLGNGDGTLQAERVFSLDTLTPLPSSNACIVVTDLNGDGRLDVVTLADGCGSCEVNPTHRGVVVWLGNGDGTFQSPVSYGGFETVHLSALALADLNGDGKLDAVVASQQDAGDTPSSLSVMLGNGDGTFGAATSFVTGPGDPFMLVLRDVNNDGKVDALVSSFDNGALALLLGNGDGTFQAPSAVNVSSDPALGLGAIAIDDFNKDGKPDVIVSTFGSPSSAGTVNIYLAKGNGDGTFQPPQEVFASTDTYSFFIGDFDGDGNADIAFNPTDSPLIQSIYRDTALIYHGNGDATFQAAQLIAGGVTVTAADFDGDGKIDLVSTVLFDYSNQSNLSPEVSVSLQPFAAILGNGLLDTQGYTRTPTALAVGDFNNDGKVDFVAAEADGAVAYLNQGSGVFNTVISATPSFPANTALGQVVVADFNGDGKLDFAYADFSNNFTGAKLGNGDGTFTLQRIPSSAGGYALAIADFNGDGTPDLVDLSSNQVQIMLGAGDGTFPLPASQQFYSVYTGNNPSNGLVVGDFNGDGKIDVAVAADSAHKTIQILLGNGDGTLQAPVSTPALAGGVVRAGTQGLVAADFNGDGKLDLAIVVDPDGVSDKNVICILLGNGDGTFQAPMQLPALAFGSAILIKEGDFDGDGTIDLIVASRDIDAPLVLLRGNGDGTFHDSEEYKTSRPSYIAAGDFAGDGRLSLAIANLDDRNVTVMLNRIVVPANPAPLVSISLSSTSITVGASSILSWSSTNATSCTASGAWSGSENVQGSAAQAPASSGTDTYSLTCIGTGGTATSSAVLTVNPAATPTPPPTVSLTADSTTITLGGTVLLTWSSTHADSCAASGGWSASPATSGTQTETPTQTGSISYNLTCTGVGGSASATLTVQVNAVTVIGHLSGKVGGGGAIGWEVVGLALLAAARVPRRRPLKRAGAATLAIAIVGAALGASCTNAADLSWDFDHAYVGLRIGAGNYEPSSQTLNGTIAADGIAGTTVAIRRYETVGSIYAGVPIVGPLALEMGFADLGSYRVQVTTDSANLPKVANAVVDRLQPAGRGGTIGLGATVDLGRWFALEPHAGLLVARSRQEVNTNETSVTHDRTYTGAAAGDELLMRPTRSVSVGGGIDCLGPSLRCNVLSYSAQLEYHFGRPRDTIQ